MLEAARKAGVRRFVNASSSSVYGKPEYLPYDEDHPTTPISPYGASKVAAEHYARVYNEVYGLPTVSLRYFTVYGPRMRPNMAFTNFVSRCLHGESPVIFGDGTQTRDFTYVNDIVDANRRLLETSVADGEVLNIGSGERITITELATVIRDEIDPEIDIVYDDPREGMPNTPTRTSRKPASYSVTNQAFRSKPARSSSSSGTDGTKIGTTRWFETRERTYLCNSRVAVSRSAGVFTFTRHSSSSMARITAPCRRSRLIASASSYSPRSDGEIALQWRNVDSGSV